jgi:hypothetical protein
LSWLSGTRRDACLHGEEELVTQLDKSSDPGRRSILRWSAAGALVAAIELVAPTRASAAADVPLTTTATGETAVLVPGREQTARLAYDLGVVAGPNTTGLPSGSVFLFTFDARVYDLHDRPLVYAGKRPVRASASKPALDESTGLTTVQVSLSEAASLSQPLTVLAGRLKPRAYPFDVVRSVTPLRAGVSDRPHGRPSTRRPSSRGRKVVESVGQPWGVETAALWSSVTWAQGFESFYPHVVSVRAVGPGVVPRRYGLRVLLDERLISSVRVTAAETAEGKALSHAFRPVHGQRGVIGVEWVAEAALQPFEVVHLSLDVTTRSPNGPLAGIKHPIVESFPPEAHRGTQRLTYLEAVTRSDSIFDAETLSARD